MMRLEHKGHSVPVSSNFLGSTTFTARRAILIYESPVIGEALATVHHVAPGGDGRNKISPGELLSAETLVNLLQTVKTEVAQTRQVLPAHVLWQDAAVMVWYREARRAPIYFSTSEAAFNKALNAQTVAHPALLFKATAGQLSIYALQSDAQGHLDRPGNETPLCFAPYFNLYDGGDMCRGNAPYPKTLDVSTIEQWERAFFDTLFTHANYRTKFLNHPGGHAGLWRAMLSAEHFPASHLVPNGLILGKVLNDEK